LFRAGPSDRAGRAAQVLLSLPDGGGCTNAHAVELRFGTHHVHTGSFALVVGRLLARVEPSPHGEGAVDLGPGDSYRPLRLGPGDRDGVAGEHHLALGTLELLVALAAGAQRIRASRLERPFRLADPSVSGLELVIERSGGQWRVES
jgi:hypothetical protein